MSNDKRKSDRDPHDRAIGKKHQSTGWIKKISIVFLSCVLALTLATPMLHAEDLQIGPAIGGGRLRVLLYRRRPLKKSFTMPQRFLAVEYTEGNLMERQLEGLYM